MIEVFLRTLPFFAIIGLGYWAGHTRFFTEQATAYLTKFVFFFALSAMLFRFAANLDFTEVWNGRLIAGYLWGTAFVYGIATAVAFIRKLDVPTAAIEAQCAVIGNVGFLGIPMFLILFGEASIGPMMMVLATDLIVFSSLIVILINGGRDGRMSPAILKTIGMGLIKNPMIVAISSGLIWSALSIPIPAVLNDFLLILGGAATPGALFAIGASLAGKSAERIEVAGWLTFCKLVLHPIFVGLGVLVFFPLDAYSAAIVVAAAAMPVAGNVFMLAQHYRVAPQRVSAAILFSTAISIATVPIVISMVSP
ncbi:MAG: AEC family transporter [Arenibacterium sp.]